MGGAGKIVVDGDTAQNINFLKALHTPRGYTVLAATSGGEAPVSLPGNSPTSSYWTSRCRARDRYEVVRRFWDNADTETLPVVDPIRECPSPSNHSAT